MIFTENNILQFLVCSYAVGWCLVGLRALRKGVVDLCQFVKMFMVAPFVVTASAMAAFVIVGFLWVVLIPHILNILSGVAIIILTCCILGLVGHFIVVPAVKKAHGIAKPLSDKICVVIYRRNRS